MEKISPAYKAFEKNGKYAISGIESTTGEKILLEDVTESKAEAKALAAFLDKNKVSVHHAKDVLSDRFYERLNK